MHYDVEDTKNVSRETWDRLRVYADIVRKWQKTINLVAPSTVDDLWSRHVLDSVQLYDLSPKPVTWLDIGSGAGFPGIVTAICLAAHGEGWVHLVESNQKKAAFLRSAILETGARATVYPVRVADAIGLVPQVDAISARALASLDQLLDMSQPWFDSNENLTVWFHKGRDYVSEIEFARSRWQFNLVKYDSQIQNESVILQISNLKPL
jgi:16S rRNA (guanine527-N7)-methyltransferase